MKKGIGFYYQIGLNYPTWRKEGRNWFLLRFQQLSIIPCLISLLNLTRSHVNFYFSLTYFRSYCISRSWPKLKGKVEVEAMINEDEIPMGTLACKRIILASRASGCHLNTQTVKDHPSRHPNTFLRNFKKYQFQAHYWISSPQYNSNGFVDKYIMPYNNKCTFMVLIWAICGPPWKKDAPIFYNCLFKAHSFKILAKTLMGIQGILHVKQYKRVKSDIINDLPGGWIWKCPNEPFLEYRWMSRKQFLLVYFHFVSVIDRWRGINNWYA